MYKHSQTLFSNTLQIFYPMWDIEMIDLNHKLTNELSTKVAMCFPEVRFIPIPILFLNSFLTLYECIQNPKFFVDIIKKQVMCFDRQPSAIRSKIGWCKVKPPNNENIYSKKL